MSRDARLWLQDIAQGCAKVGRYVEGMTFEAFVADERTYDAVLRNLELVGEAAKHLPDEEVAIMPGLDWRGIRGLRDVIAHGYFGLDDGILWDVICNRLPPLERTVAARLGQLTPPP